jgi:hypothetical protein
MQLLNRARRLWTLDLARGLCILTMIAAHSIFFFHYSINPVLQFVNGLGDFLSFTGLLLISGASAYPAYIHGTSEQHIIRIVKRLLMYVLGYYLLSCFIIVLTEGLTWQSAWDIVTFQRLVPFTEFIIPFIIFGALKLPLRPIYRFLLNHPLLLTLVAVGIYVLGSVLSSLPNLGPPSWKAIWVHHSESYSFPILHYYPVYLLGLFIGKIFSNQKNQKQIARMLLKLMLVGGISTILLLLINAIQGGSLYSLFERWPPSAPFLLSGTTFIIGLLLVIFYLKDFRLFPWTRSFLLLLGQNAFALFFTHTAMLYTYQALGFPRVYSVLLVIVLWLISLLGSLYLAKVFPLNYRFVLNYLEWCECALGFCVHSREPRLIRSLKHNVLYLAAIPKRFSITLHARKLYPLQTKNVALGVLLLFFLVTPLGYIENQVVKQSLHLDQQGKLSRQWFIPEKHPVLLYSLDINTLPLSGNVMSVSALLNGNQEYYMSNNGNQWLLSLPLKGLPMGTHTLNMRIETTEVIATLEPSTFYLSQPLLVSWTIDWEGYDVADAYLRQLADVADQFRLPMTHLFNPRIYTDAALSPDRSNFLTQYVIDRRDNHGEEIGLHLHMFPDLISAAGLNFKPEPAWGGGFSYGYDTLTTNYTYDELKTLFLYAKQVFAEKGLGEPKSYRAGGWFANMDTLRALSDTGFLIDSSARTAYTFGTNNADGYWNVSITQPPYFPSLQNQNSDHPPPTLNLLEIPNNGADDYAFSAEEMIARFRANYQGLPLVTPNQVTYLSHPQWFNSQRENKMRQVFNETSRHLYENDSGPVMYSTLIGMYEYFQP